MHLHIRFVYFFIFIFSQVSSINSLISSSSTDESEELDDGSNINELHSNYEQSPQPKSYSRSEAIRKSVETFIAELEARSRNVLDELPKGAQDSTIFVDMLSQEYERLKEFHEKNEFDSIGDDRENDSKSNNGSSSSSRNDEENDDELRKINSRIGDLVFVIDQIYRYNFQLKALEDSEKYIRSFWLKDMITDIEIRGVKDALDWNREIEKFAAAIEAFVRDLESGRPGNKAKINQCNENLKEKNDKLHARDWSLWKRVIELRLDTPKTIEMHKTRLRDLESNVKCMSGKMKLRLNSIVKMSSMQEEMLLIRTRLSELEKVIKLESEAYERFREKLSTEDDEQLIRSEAMQIETQIKQTEMNAFLADLSRTKLTLSPHSSASRDKSSSTPRKWRFSSSVISCTFGFAIVASLFSMYQFFIPLVCDHINRTIFGGIWRESTRSSTISNSVPQIAQYMISIVIIGALLALFICVTIQVPRSRRCDRSQEKTLSERQIIMLRNEKIVPVRRLKKKKIKQKKAIDKAKNETMMRSPHARRWRPK